MSCILITGINGFLGSNLAKRFSNNHKIVGTEFSLDNLSRIDGYDFQVYQSDLENLRKLFNENRIDIVIHASTLYGRNNEELLRLLQSNLISPFHVLDLAIKNKVHLFINTDSALERLTNAYSLTKKQFLDWLAFRSYEIKTANLQLEHFYGPGTGKNNFIAIMISKLLKNEHQIDLTLGEQRRDFIYYEDVLDAYEIIVNSYNGFEENFNHFEIGSGEVISIRALLILLKKLTGSTTKLNFGAIPYRENEMMESTADLMKINLLGFRINNSLESGLGKTIDWIRKNI